MQPVAADDNAHKYFALSLLDERKKMNSTQKETNLSTTM